MKNRIEWVDIARGIGIVLVLLGHAGMQTKINFIYMFHMPLFFFLSGYVFDYQFNNKGFCLKKFKSLMVPYFSYSFLIIIYDVLKECGNKVFNLNVEYNIFSDIFRLLILQNRYTTLWFLPVLFLLNIELLFLIKLTKCNFKIMNGIILFLCIIGCVYYRSDYLIMNYNIGFVNEAMSWNVDVITTAMPFFYFGYLLKINKYNLNDKLIYLTKNKEIIKGLELFILGIILGTLGYIITGNTLEMFEGEYAFELLTFPSAILCILGLITLSKKIHNKLIAYIGKNSMVFFATHYSIVYSLLWFVFKIANLFQGQLSFSLTLLKPILMTVIALIFGWIFNELFNKFRITREMYNLKNR